MAASYEPNVQKSRAETQGGTAPAAAPDRRQALRGMDFEAQTLALTPSGGGPAVQRMAAPGGTVQREAASDAGAQDDEMFDPAKHMSAMGKTPREQASELKPAIEAQNAAAREAYAPISAELAALEEKLKTLEGEDKAKAEARQKELKEKVAPIERTIKQTSADLATLEDPSADSARYNEILARQKAAVPGNQASRVDDHSDPLEKKWSENKQTKTSTGYEGGSATRVVEESKTNVGLSGYSQTNSRTSEEVTAEGKKTGSHTQTSTLGKDGLTFDEAKKEAHEKDGKSSSAEQKTSTKLGPAGASQTRTETVTAEDGSSKSKTESFGVERGGGKLGLSSADKSTTKDAGGNEESVSSKTKGGLIAGKDGLGGYAEHDKEYERKSASGLKTGAVGGLNGNVVCNVEEVPDSNPKKYRVTLSVNLGAKLGASAGYEKEGSAGKGGVSVSGEGSVTMNVAKTLTEEEAKAYLENLKSASAGGSGGGGREFAVIQTGVTKGWQAAQLLYEGAKAGVADPAVIAGMQDGDKIELGKEGKLGGSGDLGGEGGGVSIGLQGGYEVSKSSKMSVEKVDGKFVYTPSESEAAKVSGGATLGVGVVKGGMSGSHTDKSGTSYKFTLDPKDPQFAEMQAALAACNGQADLDAFAKKYPKAIGEKTKTVGHEDTQSGTIGVGPAEVGLNYGSSYEEKTVTDGEGKVTGKGMEGTNTGGMTVKVGSLQIGGSSKEAASAQVDAEGKASVDVGQTDTQTDAAKWLEANVPFAGGKKEEEGTLSKLAGGGAKPDTDTKSVAGMALGDGDLQGLGGLAMNPGKWMSACPSPRLRDDWAKAGAQIRAAGGSSAAVAKALAEFVGKGGHGRDDVIYAAMRDPGEVGSGKRYEFPEGLMKLKPTYDALVAGDAVKAIGDLEAKEGKEKAKAKGVEMVGQLDSLYNAISGAASQFQQPAVQSEMLAAITAKKGEIQAKVRVLSGGKADELSHKELTDKYNDLLSNCTRYKDTESDCFAKIEETYKDDHTSLDETIANAKLLKQLRDLHAVWNKDYDEMAALAQEHGFGQDRYWKYKPDVARFQRAQAGRPGAATEAQPETEDKRKKKEQAPAQPKDPIGEENKKLEKNRQAQADSISGRVSPSKNKAWGAGNKLHAWIQKERKPAAIDAHNRGMVKLKSADGYAAKLPKDASVLDWETYGFFAVQDYQAAAAIFEEGLAHYPPGWPPKS